MRKQAMVFLCALTLIMVFFYKSKKTNHEFNSPKVILSKTFCYHQSISKKLETLPSIQELDPKGKSNIFFIETSCTSEMHGKIAINARQACSVEAAAALHPNFDIYLLFVSPGIVKLQGTESDRFLQALLSYSNVKMKHLNLDEYFRETPVENLWTSGKIEASRFVYSHTSDVLRFLTLWKYGGIYLDLDVILTKPIDISLNFACIESAYNMGAGVLSFDSNREGHKLATQCLEDLHERFNGEQFINNGPGVITRLVRRICSQADILKISQLTQCLNFSVLPSEMFYPVPYPQWRKFFEEKYLDEVMQALKRSYGVHLWNKLNSDRKTLVNRKVAYIMLAEKYCPRVFREANRFF